LWPKRWALTASVSRNRATWKRLWREALAYKDGPVVVDAVVDPYALSLPSHVPFQTAKGYTLSLAKQVLLGRFDDVIKTMEPNTRLV